MTPQDTTENHNKSNNIAWAIIPEEPIIFQTPPESKIMFKSIQGNIFLKFVIFIWQSADSLYIDAQFIK